MKLSEQMRANCPSPENENCGCGWVDYADEVVLLEAKIEVMEKYMDYVEVSEKDRQLLYGDID